MLERWSSYRNIRYETVEHSRFHHLLSIPLAELLMIVSRAEIKGSLPKEGPAIIAPNHTSDKDPFLLHLLAIVKARRTISCFARRSMLEEGAEDSKEAQSRRTQRDEKGAKWKLRQWYLNGFNPIPVDIKSVSSDSNRVNIAAFKKATEELRQGRLIGIFLQGTRKPQLDLVDALDGIAVLARRNPDVPIYPVGFNGTDKGITGKIKINVGEPFTFREMSASGNVTDFVVDRIAKQIEEPSLKSAWRLSRKIGWSKEDIEKSRGIYPEIGETADLLEQIARTDPDFLKLPQPEIDRQIETAAVLID